MKRNCRRCATRVYFRPIKKKHGLLFYFTKVNSKSYSTRTELRETSVPVPAHIFQVACYS